MILPSQFHAFYNTVNHILVFIIGGVSTVAGLYKIEAILFKRPIIKIVQPYAYRIFRVPISKFSV